MAKSKYLKFPLVEVTWLDHSGDAGWIDEETLKEAPPEMRTVGWLVREDNTRVQIMNTLTNDGGYGGLSDILKSCITKQRVLRKTF